MVSPCCEGWPSPKGLALYQGLPTASLLLLLLLLTLCSVCPPDSCDCGCFLWPLCPTHTALIPTPCPLGRVRVKWRRWRCVPLWDVGTYRLSHSLSISSNGLFSSCTHDPVHRGERVRVRNCLMRMRPPASVNNYRITSIFIAFLLRQNYVENALKLKGNRIGC